MSTVNKLATRHYKKFHSKLLSIAINHHSQKFTEKTKNKNGLDNLDKLI